MTKTVSSLQTAPGSATRSVTVRLFGIRRELIDHPEVTVEVPVDATPRMLVAKLGDEYGPRVARRLLTAGGRFLGNHVCLAVNDMVVGPESLDIPLSQLGGNRPDISLAVVFSVAGG